jgi:outer membrane protein OmpA-like peptidoglycan-associated protein
MKKAVLCLLIVAFAVTVNSQTADKKWGVGAGAGAYGTLENGGIGIIPELYFGRYLSPRLDLMLRGNLGVLNSNVSNNLDLAASYLNLRFKLANETKKLRPYLYAGPGFLADNSEKGLSFDLGLGAKYYFRPGIALYLDAGYMNGVEYTLNSITDRENLWKTTAGLEFDFGKSKDSDGDGVSDKKDKCPNTPAGVAVDEKGCPKDSDGDGVADNIDECPTVAGLTSLKGCPDKDKDGIADKDDACPDVAGVKNLKGCPDADGDGVADKDDKCPDTKKGMKVDASGCPSDQDKDGVPDSEDDCPTVAGTKENKGCPAKEAEVKPEENAMPKIEPVYFDYDKSTYKSGEKAKVDKVVSLLKENKDYKVKVAGYTDGKGTDDYNLNLSKRRVNTVVNTLTSNGIKKARISTDAKGKANPTSSNDTDEGRALNRRVEFEITK